MARLPLHGVRILDFTVVWAGPSATMLLADLGAQVIRVESIQHPSVVTRGSPRPVGSQLAGVRGSYYPDSKPGARPWNRYAYFNYMNRNKYSVTMDVTRPEGFAALTELVSVSDVIVENNRANTMPRLGITYEAMRNVRPDLIYLSMPAFGTTGPYALARGFGANTEAAVGFTWLRGYPDADPSMTYAIFHADAAAGATAAFIVSSALHYRRRTGKGQFIDMSQGENMMHHMSHAFMDYSMNRRSQETLGNSSPILTQGVYACAESDTFVALSIGSDAQWGSLVRVLGCAGLERDPRFANGLARRRNQDSFDEIVGRWASERNAYEVMEALQSEGVPATPVISYRQAHYDPHLTEKGFFESVNEVDAGTHTMGGRGYQLSSTSLHTRLPAPGLGHHNDFLYRNLLGYSDNQIEGLKGAHHLGEAYLGYEEAPT